MAPSQQLVQVRGGTATPGDTANSKPGAQGHGVQPGSAPPAPPADVVEVLVVEDVPVDDTVLLVDEPPPPLDVAAAPGFELSEVQAATKGRVARQKGTSKCLLGERNRS